MRTQLSFRGTWAAILLSATLALLGCARSPEARSARFLDAGKKLLEKKDPARAVLQFRNAASLTPNNAEVYYQLGIAYLAEQDAHNGIANLARAVQLNPKHAAAQLRLSQLMIFADDHDMLDDARQRLQGLVDESFGGANALRSLGLVELKLGDSQSGLRHLQDAVTAAPAEILAAATLAEVKLERQDVKGAEEVLQKSAAIMPKSPDPLIILARVYLIERKFTEGEQALQRALALKPDYPPALANLAILENTMGRKAEAAQHFKRLSNLADDTYNRLYATFLYQEGKRPEAIQELERLVRQFKDDRQARSALVAAYAVSGRTGDAFRVLDETLKKNHNDLDALLQRGELYLKAARYTDAEMDLNRVLNLKPDSADAHYALARLHEARGAGELQRKELIESLTLNPLALQVRLDLVRALIRDQGAQAAIDVLDHTPQAQKSSLAYIEARNWALIRSGNAAELRRGLDSGLAVSRTPVLLVQDAFLKLSAKDYNAARQSAGEAFEKDPNEVRALRIIAQTYMDQKQMPEGIQKIRDYVAKAPNSAEAQIYLGRLFAVAGKLDEARQAFTAAKAADPTSVAANLALAQLDVKSGRSDLARKQASDVLTAHPDDTSARLFLAQMDIIDRRFQPAADTYLAIIRNDPSNVIVLNNLAYSLAETGRHDEALKYGQRAKEIAPERGDVDDTLGWVMYQKGVYNSAVQYLKMAVSRDNTALNNYHLAMAYWKSGNQKLGRETLKVALSKDPTLPEANAARQLLNDGQVQ